MNSRFAFAVLLATCACVATASESLVTNLVVRQRKPWSNVVDIDYVYTGSCPTSMTYTATWDGQTTPVDLVTLTSTSVNIQPGQVAFTWDPSAAGYGKIDLKNFKVSIAPAKQDPRTYLVIDLVDGGYTTMADVPAGGWTDEYKTTKMAFRRIPAGTYRLGYPHAEFYAVAMATENGTTRPIAQNGDVRTVTLTSDFYFAVFLATSAQVGRINGLTGTAKSPYYHAGSYSFFRGDMLDDGETVVNWPQTGYRVKTTSLIGKLRGLCDGLLVDLATDDQWEVAMRAGTTTFLPNGEPSVYTYETWDPLFRELFWNAATKLPDDQTREKEADPSAKDVGLKSPNRWGVYDFNVREEPVLDWANDREALTAAGKYDLKFPEGGTDRVGPTSSCHNLRVVRGGSAIGPTWCPYNYPVTTRMGKTEANMTCNFRFAIHLKPLTSVK